MNIINFISARLLRFWDALDDEWLKMCGYVF